LLSLRTSGCRSRSATARRSALLASADPYLVFRRAKIAELAANTSMPVMYPYRDFPEGGGLMSYGVDLADTYRQLAH